MNKAWLNAGIVCILALLINSARLYGVTVQPGDLIVAESSVSVLSDIVDVNPVTGTLSVISKGGNLLQPTGICLGSSGNIFVSDFGNGIGGGKILRINLQTGQQSIIASGYAIPDPTAIAMDSSGNLVVAGNGSAAFNVPSVVTINLTTDAVTPISSGNLIQNPAGLTIEPSGDYLVSNVQGSGNAIVRVDAVSGAESVLTSGNYIVNGQSDSGDLVIDTLDSQRVLAVVGSEVRENSGIVAVDRVTGNQSLITSGNLLEYPGALAQNSQGNIFVTATSDIDGDNPQIVEVNPLTGAQTAIAALQPLQDAKAIIVVPEPDSLSLISIIIFRILGLCHSRR